MKSEKPTFISFWLFSRHQRERLDTFIPCDFQLQIPNTKILQFHHCVKLPCPLNTGSLRIFVAFFSPSLPNYIQSKVFHLGVSPKAAEADKTIRGVVFQSTLKKCLAFKSNHDIFVCCGFGGGEVVSVIPLMVQKSQTTTCHL